MSLFGSHESYLGIDIGNSAIKVVECENFKGKPKLLTYGYVEQSSDMLTSNTQEAKDAIVKALIKLQEAAKTSSRNAVAALPSYTVFTSIIRLPEMPKKELVAAVQWEAKKFVPMPLEEMVLDWKILPEHEVTTAFAANRNSTPVTMMPQVAQQQQQTAKIEGENKKYLKILLTAAPKDLVARYVEIFQAAKLNLISLETESFALERSLIGRDKSAIMLIDIGSVATTISVVVDAVPLINRSIDTGGYTITKVIASSLNIDLDRAEQFKRDFGLMQGGAAAGQIPQRIEILMQSIINEVRYVLNLYHSQGNGMIEKIILSGGSAWLPNIPQYFSQVLNTKVFIGDPWARMMYPVELKPVLQQIGPRLAVSIGLAMREIS
ncbi:MAG: pilus assembly protein PilM [Candidatus Kerfeldbacteria bacterium]|nr:pilus assembly protein PilM [Candidatus Kerfeldbacteria bacterium]